MFVNLALEIDTSPDPIRVWTGEGDVMIEGELFRSAQGIITFGDTETGRSIDERTTITFPVVNDAARAALLAGIPADAARTFLILSTDYRTFVKVPQVIGTISQPRIDNLEARLEIETAEGDVDRQRPTFISHESQINQYPGDHGLKDLETLAKGLRFRF